MRNRRLLGAGLTVLALGLNAVLGPGTSASPAAAAAVRVRPGGTDPSAAPGAAAPAHARSAAGPGSAAAAHGGPCGAFPGARQLSGADGIVPAAWSGDGLVVPACGPAPGAGGGAAPVYAYPGALWTAGYQCLEFSERYLYDRFGVTMGIATDGDEVAARYAAAYAGLFTLIRNGTPRRAPAAGDVLSLSTTPGFDSASGGHSAVVQSSAVNAAGNGTVTVVEENAAASGVAVLPVAGWTVRYPGFPYIEWLTASGLTVTSPHPPPVQPGRRYSFTLTATGGHAPYHWQVSRGTLPPGLTLSAAGVLAGTAVAVPSAGDSPPDAPAQPGDWTVTVAVTDARGATAAATLSLPVSARDTGSRPGGD